MDNNVNKQHCYTRNNKTHVTMVFRNSTEVQSGLRIVRVKSGLEIGRVRTCVFGCGLL
jgi:hypothetical protein